MLSQIIIVKSLHNADSTVWREQNKLKWSHQQVARRISFSLMPKQIWGSSNNKPYLEAQIRHFNWFNAVGGDYCYHIAIICCELWESSGISLLSTRFNSRCISLALTCDHFGGRAGWIDAYLAQHPWRATPTLWLWHGQRGLIDNWLAHGADTTQLQESHKISRKDTLTAEKRKPAKLTRTKIHKMTTNMKYTI